MKKCSIEGCKNLLLAKSFCGKHYARFRKSGDPHKTIGAPTGAPTAWILETLKYRGDDCQFWPFGRLKDGRGIVVWEGKIEYASRVMCQLAHGDPPSDKHEAAHNCGNGNLACANPMHLRWDTATGNQADRVKHKTTNRGERCGSHKLTEVDILEIRGSKGLPIWWLAKKYSVHPTHINRIFKADRWSWLS